MPGYARARTRRSRCIQSLQNVGEARIEAIDILISLSGADRIERVRGAAAGSARASVGVGGGVQRRVPMSPDLQHRLDKFVVDALEKLAAGRGATRLTTEASDTARPFFAGRGYVAERRETVIREGEWLGRTVMAKELGGGQAGAGV